MRPTAFYLLLMIYFFGSVHSDESAFNGQDKINVGNASAHKRHGKLFSLFNIVQFQNTGCRSSSSVSGSGGTANFRNGTCFTASECASKGGMAAGNCAAGFGVCCLFLVTASGSVVSQNCTYLRNPGYPATFAGTTTTSYTVNKLCPGVCSLRLDFESFTILGTASSSEDASGGSCIDAFTVTTTTNFPVPVICGQNTGQHIYVDLGALASDSATLSFSFVGSSTTRQWEIKVTQLPCGSAAKYSICIRAELGYCCIEYSVCSDPNSFSLDSGAAAANDNFAGTDSQCSTYDYVGIPSAQLTCSVGSGGAVVNKFCGARLNTANLANANAPVCDCTEPFLVNIYTDATNTLAGTIIADSNRGVCLNYVQIPCDTGF